MPTTIRQYRPTLAQYKKFLRLCRGINSRQALLAGTNYKTIFKCDRLSRTSYGDNHRVWNFSVEGPVSISSIMSAQITHTGPLVEIYGTRYGLWQRNLVLDHLDETIREVMHLSTETGE